jgi:LysR family hydrogen peroxide-inducible transcriptional activator
MNLRDMQYLTAVADLQHFGKAAERCHVSQPTLSMQIKKLEESLGVTIFERSNKQLLITSAGEKILPHVRRLLAELEEIKQIAKTAQDPLAGDFTLGAFPTLAPYFLPKILPAIGKALPKLKLWLVEEKTDVLLEKLKKGTLDAALIALPIADESLESQWLCDDDFVLAVPPPHPLAKKRMIHPKDIQNECLLLLDEGHCLRHQALEVCSLIGSSEHQGFRATSLETLRQMVAAGVGITLLPTLALRKDDGIATIPFAPPAPSRSIGLVWRKHSVRDKVMPILANAMKSPS